MPLPCHGLLKNLKKILYHNCKPESLVRYPQNTNHIYHTCITCHIISDHKTAMHFGSTV